MSIPSVHSVSAYLQPRQCAIRTTLQGPSPVVRHQAAARTASLPRCSTGSGASALCRYPWRPLPPPQQTHWSTNRRTETGYFRQRVIAAQLSDSSVLASRRSPPPRLPLQRSQPSFNGVFLLILLNLGLFIVDHVIKAPVVKWLYLDHSYPRWYQFVTATFCHANWAHLSSNLFALYIAGKLVEEEEGSFGVWVSYLLTGLGANLVSWLLLPRACVSVGASGAVFGLYAVSVLVKIGWDWKKILEVLILGQFVVEKVLAEVQMAANMGGAKLGTYSINHVAHLAGALVGVALIWLISRFPKQSPPPIKQSGGDAMLVE